MTPVRDLGSLQLAFLSGLGISGSHGSLAHSVSKLNRISPTDALSFLHESPQYCIPMDMINFQGVVCTARKGSGKLQYLSLTLET